MTATASIQLLQDEAYNVTLADGTQHIGAVFSGLSFKPGQGAVAEFYCDESGEGGQLEIPLSAIAHIE